MNVIAFFRTLPSEYLRGHAARRALPYILDVSGSYVTSYAHRPQRAINLLITGIIFTMVMIAMVAASDRILMRVPNLGISYLDCALLGMLTVRMQLVYDLESDERKGSAFVNA